MRGFKTIGTYMLALSLFNLAACSSMQPVALPAEGYAPDAIEVGQQVELLTREGMHHRFTVREVDEQGIGGAPGFFPYGEIESLQVKAPGEGSVLVAALVVVAITALFWVAVDEATKAALSPGL